MKEYIVQVEDDNLDADELPIGYIRAIGEEVIRCNDCYFADKDFSGWIKIFCRRTNGFMYDDDYCSRGERREMNETERSS